MCGSPPSSTQRWRGLAAACANAGPAFGLQAANGARVPVRLSLSQREEPAGLKHVARITAATDEDYLNERRTVGLERG
eukprot:359578-Chlamydomonas_euryale.AAC.2